VAYDHDEVLGYNLCAIIVGGGKVLSTGYNKHSRNGFVQSLEIYDKSTKPFINTHAEVDAIQRIRSKIDLTGCKIFIARVKKTGIVGLARPCPICEMVLYRYGITRAYYTMDSNTYGIMNIKAQGITTDRVYSGESYELENCLG
jgi:tRNA(Arg) A34 adenosine deaminase TadA